MFIDRFKFTGGVLLMKRKMCFILMLAMAFMAPGLWAQADLDPQVISMVSDNPPSDSSDNYDDDPEVSVADLTVDNSAADNDIGVGDQPTNDLPGVTEPGPVDRPTNDLPGVTEPGIGARPLPGASAPNPGDQPLPEIERLRNMRKEAQAMIQQGMFKKAEAMLESIDKAVKASGLSEDRKNAFRASLARHEKFAFHSGQGQYQKAADAVRQAISIKESKNDRAKLLKVQEKVGLQQDWYKRRLSHIKETQKLVESKTPLLKQKLEILKQLDSKKRFSDEELKKIQADLKAINEKLQPINKKHQEVRTAFAAEREKIKEAGIILNASQREKLAPMIEARRQARAVNMTLRQDILKRLTNIAESKEVSWDRLKENLTSLTKLQDEMYRLRKALHDLSKKGTLTREEYQSAKKMRAQLDKLMEQADRLMDKVENAFINQKVFSKLTAKEKIEFVKLFKDVWLRDKKFDNLKPSLEEIYRKIFGIPVADPVMPIRPDPIRPDPIRPDPRPTEPIPLLNGTGMIIQEGVLQFENRLYYPTNLPRQYRVNRLEVKFAATVQTIRTQEAKVNAEWWEKLTPITFTFVHAPQLPDQPFERPVGMATPTEVIEENIDNQNRPSNLMNAF